MLEKHHPELKDVWDDAARTAPIGAPVKAAQPPDLKVTLLPFQQESLHWFKEQEQTVWRGGMLAVCSFIPISRDRHLLIVRAGRNGVSYDLRLHRI